MNTIKRLFIKIKRRLTKKKTGGWQIKKKSKTLKILKHKVNTVDTPKKAQKKK